MTVAMECAPLNTVISRGAELFSLAELKHLDKDGNEIENSTLLNKLKSPNPLQTRKEFLYEFYVLNAVYGKTFQNVIRGLSFEKEPAVIWLLPSGQVKIKVTGKLYQQSKLEEIIEGYEMTGYDTPFSVEDVIFMKEGIGTNPLDPTSRIEALKIPLSNIQAVLKSFNIITTERGQIGFLSSEPMGDSYGKLPLDAKESERLRTRYQETQGLDSEGGHVNFTHSNVKWIPMTFDVQQLQLFPGMEQSFGLLCDAYGHRRDLYASDKGATYENQKEAKKQTIQDAIQPLADRLAENWTDAFIDPAKGEYLELCYDHLPCMKEDELKEEQANKIKIDGLEVLYTNGIISAEEFASEADVELTGDGVIKQRQMQNNSQVKP